MVIIISFLIYPKIGKVHVQSKLIEQDRWLFGVVA